MYLLDTNVISELRRMRPHGAVLAWIQGVPDDEVENLEAGYQQQCWGEGGEDAKAGGIVAAQPQQEERQEPVTLNATGLRNG